MNKAMRIIAILLSLVMLLMLCACGGDTSDAATTPAEEETVVETSEGGTKSITVGSTNEEWIVSLDVNGITTGTCSFGYNYLCYDQLVYWDPIKDELASDILEDWFYDEDDNQTLYLKLKDGIYFANGDKMTGEDVLFSLEMMLDNFSFGEYYLYIDFENSYVEDDGLTVVVKYNQPFAPGVKGFICCWVEDKSWVEEHGGLQDMDYYDISLANGSGPYKIVDFVKDTSMRLEYREDWWMADSRSDDYCPFDEITMLQYSDATTMMIDFENKVLDVALYGVTDSDIRRFDSGETEGAYKIVNTNSNALIVLDPEQEEVSDLRVRQAICKAIDCEAISDAVFGVLGVPADSFLNSATAGYVGGNAYEYDPEGAKALLEEAGVTDLHLKMISTSADDEVEIAEMVQAYLAEVGITMDVEVMDMDSAVANWMDPTTSGQLQQFKSAGGNVFRDPIFVTSAYLPTTIFSILSRESGDVADLIQTGIATMDEEERIAITEELQSAFYENAEIIPLCEWNAAYCYNTDTIADMTLDSVYSPELRWITLAQ